MQRINIRGIELNIAEFNRGASETLVMVHGLFTNMSVFYLQIAPELASRYHVVLYDLRSHGLSEWTDEGYTLQCMTEDLIAVMDTLEISRAHLIGYSFGGLIALNSVLKYPERFDKLAVIEAPDPGNDKLHKQMDEQGSGYLNNVIEKYSKVNNIVPGARLKAKAQKLYEHLFLNPAIRAEMASDSNFMANKRLESIEHPTVLIYAKESDCLDTGRMLCRRIPDAVLEICEGDHNIPVQQPKWISDKIENFLIKNIVHSINI